ncbi:MAG: TerC family protein [Gemmatimonadota bacterium]|nr:TerC family protein [Gemmatimonadota bacterium]MDH5282426.1 TerC family protein [Gemmatimonadota bacterium]
MITDPAVWITFIAVVGTLMVLDLGVLNRRSHVLSQKEALSWSAGITGIALLFGVFLWLRLGSKAGLEYFAGYLIELSLSVDNLFVFLLIFQYFAVPAALQPRVLKWGIFGAIVMRAIMISAGVLLLQQFTWIVYLFGAILVITGIRMFRVEEAHIDPEKNPLVRLARRLFPVTSAYEDQRFFVTRAAGGVLATPLLLVLLVVEWSDLVFAIDSIPAVFAVTRDPFIVYSSNLFAILGLRALFFVLAGALDRFHYIKPGVALILVFVGAKMISSAWIHPSTALSLAVIVTILFTSVVLSLLRPRTAT